MRMSNIVFANAPKLGVLKSATVSQTSSDWVRRISECSSWACVDLKRCTAGSSNGTSQLSSLTTFAAASKPKFPHAGVAQRPWLWSIAFDTCPRWIHLRIAHSLQRLLRPMRAVPMLAHIWLHDLNWCSTLTHMRANYRFSNASKPHVNWPLLQTTSNWVQQIMRMIKFGKCRVKNMYHSWKRW